MAAGLYPDRVVIERFSASPGDGNIAQRFIAPFDIEVLGMALYSATAPGSTNVMTVNVSNFPTSQQGGAFSSVGAYNLWTAANVPSVTGSATSNLVTSNTTALVENLPYALNYPLPGPAGTIGYETAQATSQITTNPVTAPPTVYQFKLASGLVAPDNTYLDYNSILTTAGTVHGGDVLTFVVGGTVGSAANLEIILYGDKR
jgi:hypothetical protein